MRGCSAICGWHLQLDAILLRDAGKSCQQTGISRRLCIRFAPVIAGAEARARGAAPRSWEPS